jgi:hypothetical protein
MIFSFSTITLLKIRVCTESQIMYVETLGLLLFGLNHDSDVLESHETARNKTLGEPKTFVLYKIFG